MSIRVINPGQYVLGGISAPSTSVTGAFQAGVGANLGRRDAKQAMQERDQLMQVRAAEEQRAQQMFELGLQDRAAAAARANAAAARAAQVRQAQADLRAGLRPPTGAPGTAPTSITPGAPPPRTVTVPSGSVPPLPGAGLRPPSDVLQGGGGGNAAGGGGADTLGAYPTISPGGSQNLQSMAARAAMAGIPTGYAASATTPMTTDPVQVEINNAHVRRQIAEVDAVIASISEAMDTNPAATLQRVNDLRRQREALVSQLQAVEYVPAPRDIFTEEGPGAAGLQPQTATPTGPGTAPSAGLSFGGVPPSDTTTLDMGEATGAGFSFGGMTPTGRTTLDMGEVVRATDGEPSRLFRGNTAFQQRQLEQSDQRLAQLAATLDYYDKIGDTNSYLETLKSYSAEQENRFFLDGMAAVTAIDAGDFGPAQYLLQTQWFADQEVELRPYTDGSVDVIVGGQSERMSWTELADYMRGGYDRQAMNYAATIADAQLSGAVKLAEEGPLEELKGDVLRRTEITKAQLERGTEITKAQLELWTKRGTLERLGTAQPTPDGVGTQQMANLTLKNGAQVTVQVRDVAVPVEGSRRPVIVTKIFSQGDDGAFTRPVTPDMID